MWNGAYSNQKIPFKGNWSLKKPCFIRKHEVSSGIWRNGATRRDFETQYKQILTQLKLQTLEAKVNTLSGGQQKRLALCALLENRSLVWVSRPITSTWTWLNGWKTIAKSKITLLMVAWSIFSRTGMQRNNWIGQWNLYSYKVILLSSTREARMTREKWNCKTKQHFKQELDWIQRQPKARTTKSKSRIEIFKIIERKHKNADKNTSSN